MYLKISLLFAFLFLGTFESQCYAQAKTTKTDTIIQKKVKDTGNTKQISDTVKKVRSIASKAALKSALLPGLGQIYNKKYWKLPLVYGALAFPISTFNYNRTWYRKTRFAYATRINKDTANFLSIDAELQPLSSSSLKLYRNEFRKNMDFSVIGLLLLWGLNVVDATVDGHLRTFDISDDLSLKVKPVISNNLSTGGISLTLNVKKKEISPKTISF
jgi:hypothetical protein